MTTENTNRHKNGLDSRRHREAGLGLSAFPASFRTCSGVRRASRGSNAVARGVSLPRESLYSVVAGRCCYVVEAPANLAGLAHSTIPCYQPGAMRRAAIDIGTNTVKLLVAEVTGSGVAPVVSKDEATRLGEGAEAIGQLAPSAIARTSGVVAAFLEEALRCGASDVRILATSAVRDATNHQAFTRLIQERCGTVVEVLSGDREAELILAGVDSDPTWASQLLLVMDVGGGSAEWIAGQSGRMQQCRSLPLGAVRLTEQFGEAKLVEMESHLRAVLGPVLNGFAHCGGTLIGTGGTITNLARIATGQVDHALLATSEVRDWVNRLAAMSLAERMRVGKLPANRADIIVAGGLVFAVAMELLSARELTVSVRGLRYGVLRETAG